MSASLFTVATEGAVGAPCTYVVVDKISPMFTHNALLLQERLPDGNVRRTAIHLHQAGRDEVFALNATELIEYRLLGATHCNLEQLETRCRAYARTAVHAECLGWSAPLVAELGISLPEDGPNTLYAVRVRAHSDLNCCS